MAGPEIPEAIAELDALTRRLRRECPWDREQDERSIVPHTVEEAYELADAANSGDDSKLLDELGDVLFQVHFLALLLEERAAGDLAAVAEHCVQKLIRRHPHVFSDVEVQGAGEVLRNWDAIKRTEPGREDTLFGDVPENLPALLHARKVQCRAASSGFDFPGVEGPLRSVRDELCELERVAARQPARNDAEPEHAAAHQPGNDEQAFHELGDVLFATVNLSRKLLVDPELALRAASRRFAERLEAAAVRAASAGERWPELPPERQLEHYASARLEQGI